MRQLVLVDGRGQIAGFGRQILVAVRELPTFGMRPAHGAFADSQLVIATIHERLGRRNQGFEHRNTLHKGPAATKAADCATGAATRQTTYDLSSNPRSFFLLGQTL